MQKVQVAATKAVSMPSSKIEPTSTSNKSEPNFAQKIQPTATPQFAPKPAPKIELKPILNIPPKPEPKIQQKESMSDIVLGPIRQWVDFIRTQGADYLMGLLKISLVSLVTQWVMLLLLLLIAGGIYLALGGIDGIVKFDAIVLLVLALIFGILFMIALFLISWISQSIGSTSLVYTDAKLSGKGFDLFATFSRIKYNVLKAMLVATGIYIALQIPYMILWVGMMVIVIGFVGLSSLSTNIAFILLIIAMILYFVIYFLMLAYQMFTYLFYMVFGFVAQFWGYGYILENFGIIESLKRSFNIIKKSALESIIFYLIWVIITMLLSAPLLLFFILAYIGLYAMPYLIAGMSVQMISLVVVVLVILGSLITVFLSSIPQAFSFPTHVLFWKKVKDRFDESQK